MADNIRRGLRVYCGMKEPLPPGYGSYGSRFQCFKKGFAVGKTVQERTFAQRMRDRQYQVEAATTALTRRQLAEQINQRGIGVLKRELRLGSLSKDLVRSIAVRLTGTNDAVPQYWRLSQEQLIQELVQRGFQR